MSLIRFVDITSAYPDRDDRHRCCAFLDISTDHFVTSPLTATHVFDFLEDVAYLGPLFLALVPTGFFSRSPGGARKRDVA